jgi:hypothetical protein
MINLHFEAKTWDEILVQLKAAVGAEPPVVIAGPQFTPEDLADLKADVKITEPNLVPPSIPTETPVSPPGVSITPPGIVTEPTAVLAAQKAAMGVELDSAGLPWSDQIHARTKTKTADGKWKLKRGADPKLIAQVQAAQPVELPGPAAIVPEAIPATVETFMAYAAKIDAAGAGSYVEIQAHLAAQGIANIIQVPEEKIPEVAESLRAKFGTAF